MDPLASEKYSLTHPLARSQSGNGLLFRHAPSRTISYIVCNPATEQWAAVPSEHTPADKHDGARRTYLVFDPAVSSHFQLVTIALLLLENRGVEAQPY